MFLFQNNNTQDTYENIERDLLEKQFIIDQKNEIIKHLEKKNEELEKGPEEHHILGKLIHERPDGVQIYASTCRKLFPNTRSWEFNRPLDKDHVKALQKIITDKHCLEGHLDILNDGNELCIVNGQHRFEAIYELMEADIEFNREIIVNVHKVYSFNSNESNQIFIATNNIKNVKKTFSAVANATADTVSTATTTFFSTKSFRRLLDNTCVELYIIEDNF